jgi:hypothetical protein
MPAEALRRRPAEITLEQRHVAAICFGGRPRGLSVEGDASGLVGHRRDDIASALAYASALRECAVEDSEGRPAFDSARASLWIA